MSHPCPIPFCLVISKASRKTITVVLLEAGAQTDTAVTYCVGSPGQRLGINLLVKLQAESRGHLQQLGGSLAVELELAPSQAVLTRGRSL